MHGHFEVFLTSIYPFVQKHTHAVCIMQTNDHLFSKIFNPAPGPGKYPVHWVNQYNIEKI